MTALSTLDRLEQDIQFMHNSIDHSVASYGAYYMNAAAPPGYNPMFKPFNQRAKLTKPRWTITSAQHEQLSEIFKEIQTPSLVLRQQLAQEMGVTPRQIQVWFRNRRQRVRLSRLEESTENVNSGSDCEVGEESNSEAPAPATKALATTADAVGRKRPSEDDANGAPKKVPAVADVCVEGKKSITYPPQQELHVSPPQERAAAPPQKVAADPEQDVAARPEQDVAAAAKQEAAAATVPSLPVPMEPKTVEMKTVQQPAQQGLDRAVPQPAYQGLDRHSVVLPQDKPPALPVSFEQHPAVQHAVHTVLADFYAAAARGAPMNGHSMHETTRAIQQSIERIVREQVAASLAASLGQKAGVTPFVGAIGQSPPPYTAPMPLAAHRRPGLQGLADYPNGALANASTCAGNPTTGAGYSPAMRSNVPVCPHPFSSSVAPPLIAPRPAAAGECHSTPIAEGGSKLDPSPNPCGMRVSGIQSVDIEEFISDSAHVDSAGLFDTSLLNEAEWEQALSETSETSSSEDGSEHGGSHYGAYPDELDAC